MRALAAGSIAGYLSISKRSLPRQASANLAAFRAVSAKSCGRAEAVNCWCWRHSRLSLQPAQASSRQVRNDIGGVQACAAYLRLDVRPVRDALHLQVLLIPCRLGRCSRGRGGGLFGGLRSRVASQRLSSARAAGVGRGWPGSCRMLPLGRHPLENNRCGVRRRETVFLTGKNLTRD